MLFLKNRIGQNRLFSVLFIAFLGQSQKSGKALINKGLRFLDSSKNKVRLVFTYLLDVSNKLINTLICNSLQGCLIKNKGLKIVPIAFTYEK